MACCIIAAYIYAQITAALRRWCIYWGLMRRGPYEADLPTFFSNLTGRGPRPKTSTVMLTLIAAGMVATWAGGGFDRPSPTLASDGAMPRLSELIGIG